MPLEKDSAVFTSIFPIAEEAQEYGKMFTSIERYSQLRNYFIGCHKVSKTLWVWWSIRRSPVSSVGRAWDS